MMAAVGLLEPGQEHKHSLVLTELFYDHDIYGEGQGEWIRTVELCTTCHTVRTAWERLDGPEQKAQ